MIDVDITTVAIVAVLGAVLWTFLNGQRDRRQDYTNAVQEVERRTERIFQRAYDQADAHYRPKKTES